MQTSEIGEPITVDGKEYCFTGVSMGNPHAVVFMDGIKDMEIEKIGPSFEVHEKFPDRTNTEFVEIVDRGHVNMRVWGARFRRDSCLRNRCLRDGGCLYLKRSYRR